MCSILSMAHLLRCCLTPYLFHTPHLIGAAVLVRPDDPLLHKIAGAQASDPTLSALTAQTLEGVGNESNPALRACIPSGSSEGQYAMWGGLLYTQGRLCIPLTSTALILKILQQYHNSPLAGHYGLARTHALVAQYYTWSSVATAVSGYVGSRATCARNKVVRHAPYGLLSPLPIS